MREYRAISYETTNGDCIPTQTPDRKFAASGTTVLSRHDREQHPSDVSSND